MDLNNLKKQLLKDVEVALSDEFDRNFERKAFFSVPWKDRKTGSRGSLLLVRGGGGLRGSVRAEVTDDGITWTSHLPYADIHNEGGTITVTAKMKRFFWAKYYELSGKVKYDAKTKKQKKSTLRYSEEAEFYKNMALMKVGDKIVMPERRFIGYAPEVDVAVKEVIDEHLNTVETYINHLLNAKK